MCLIKTYFFFLSIDKCNIELKIDKIDVVGLLMYDN